VSVKWLYHVVSFPAFRRVTQTLRLAPQDAQRPFVWFDTMPDPEVGANEVILCFAARDLMPQLFQRGDTFRSKDPHKPVRFRLEWLDRVLVKDERLVPGVQAMVPDIRVTPYGHDVMAILGDALVSDGWNGGWVRPSIEAEQGEIERVAKCEGVRAGALAGLIERAPLVPLTDEKWAELENTESWECRTLEQVMEIGGLYDRDASSVIAGFLAETDMPAPIVLERNDGTLHLVAGNTRLCASRALNIRPQVVLVRLDEAPTKAKSDDEDEAAAVPRDTKVKGKRAVLNKPFDFRHAPHAKHTIAKTDPSGYRGQRDPKGSVGKYKERQDRSV
jgi:hypothetical protein